MTDNTKTSSTGLSVLTSNPTMSSLEIAELVRKQHPHVLRDIRSMLVGLYAKKDDPSLDDIDFNTINCVEIIKDERGYIKLINLDKDHSICLVTGYDVNARMRIIKRWQELEETAARQPFDIPKTLPEALRLAADLAEKNEALKAENAAKGQQIEADRPKVEFAMAVRNLEGSCLVREFAKVIKTGEKRLFKKLREDGYLMANNLPYQRYIDVGLFVVVEGTPYTDSLGKSHPAFTTRITGKGQVALEKKYRPMTTRNGLVLIQGGMEL